MQLSRDLFFWGVFLECLETNCLVPSIYLSTVTPLRPQAFLETLSAIFQPIFSILMFIYLLYMYIHTLSSDTHEAITPSLQVILIQNIPLMGN